MTTSRSVGVVAAVMLTLCAGAASASPITLNYSVTVTDRFVYGTNTPDVMAPVTFGLSLTFDDQPTNAFDDTDFLTYAVAIREYGPPTFSSIPLLTVGPTLQAGIVDSAFTIESRELSPSQDFRETSASLSVTDGAFGATALSLGRTTSPFGFVSLADVLNADITTYVQGMTAAPLVFSYASVQVDSSFQLVPGSYTYEGVATFVNANAVPEPATLSLLLLGGAAAYAAKRRKKIGRKK